MKKKNIPTYNIGNIAQKQHDKTTNAKRGKIYQTPANNNVSLKYLLIDNFSSSHSCNVHVILKTYTGLKS